MIYLFFITCILNFQTAIFIICMNCQNFNKILIRTNEISLFLTFNYFFFKYFFYKTDIISGKVLDVCLGIKPLNQKSFVSGFFNAKKFCLKKTVFKSALNQISGHIQGRPGQKGNEKETTTIPKTVTTPPPPPPPTPPPNKTHQQT